MIQTFENMYHRQTWAYVCLATKENIDMRMQSDYNLNESEWNNADWNRPNNSHNVY